MLAIRGEGRVWGKRERDSRLWGGVEDGCKRNKGERERISNSNEQMNKKYTVKKIKSGRTVGKAGVKLVGSEREKILGKPRPIHHPNKNYRQEKNRETRKKKHKQEDRKNEEKEENSH